MDTGATRTVISRQAYDKIDFSARPEQATREPLLEFGSCKVEIEMGDFSKVIEVTVGNIKDDVLLGMDIGTLDVLTSQEKIVIDGKEITCVVIKAEPKT